MKLFYSSCALLIAAFFQNAYSGKINIVNENKKTVHFRLIPEDEKNFSFRKKYGKLSVKGHSTRQFIVEPHDIKNQPVYSIEGERKFGGDTCINMAIDKDYRVTFKKDKVGTTFIAEEIKPDEMQTVASKPTLNQ